jgi:hypothetical protein
VTVTAAVPGFPGSAFPFFRFRLFRLFLSAPDGRRAGGALPRRARPADRLPPWRRQDALRGAPCPVGRRA